MKNLYLAAALAVGIAATLAVPAGAERFCDPRSTALIDVGACRQPDSSPQAASNQEKSEKASEKPAREGVIEKDLHDAGETVGQPRS